MSLSNQTYNTLKWIAQILLPALATLYLALAGLWGFPHTEAVVGTITALDTFLGALLGLAAKNYETTRTRRSTPLWRPLPRT